MCQNLYLSQTQATPDLFGSDTDTEIPPKLTREFAGIYHKPFISSPEDASTSCQHQQNLEADIETSPQEQKNLKVDAGTMTSKPEIPCLLKFGPRDEN